ncbi:MAG: TIGR03790 family protein [Kiritimatiellia bacterium]
MARSAEISSTAVVLMLCACGTVRALAPHEVLLLVNRNSADSRAIAEKFARLRDVPPENTVLLDVPEGDKRIGISREDFTKFIWKPAVGEAEKRGIAGHILAWVYSAGFPVRVSGTLPVSITGATFVRDSIPADEKIKKGAWSSPLFAGADGPGRARHFPMSFGVYANWLGDEMPLPSMMLGYTGKRGNTVEEVIKCLEKGAGSDGTDPSGTVYFVTGDDVRSNCREWQFPETARELDRMGVKAVITEKFPENAEDIIGLLTGVASVKPEVNSGYLPGCMAEHLTSLAGVFDSGGQTKLSAWIAAGCTASAGTITEPYSIWTKFPNARFYVHYASGCTIIESYYQSVRCPLQILPVGDPLAAPWTTRPECRLTEQDEETVSGVLRAGIRVKGRVGERYGDFVFLIDGREAGNGPWLEYDTSRLKPGRHTLRGVAYGSGLVRNAVWAEREIVIGE